MTVWLTRQPPPRPAWSVDTAAELLGLAARIYAAKQADVTALADRVSAFAVPLGGARP